MNATTVAMDKIENRIREGLGEFVIRIPNYPALQAQRKRKRQSTPVAAPLPRITPHDLIPAWQEGHAMLFSALQGMILQRLLYVIEQ